MRMELKQLQERLRATVVHVTHDQVEAMTLGSRIVVMEGGRIQQVGAPLDVYDQPANQFVARFIGSPPMNLVRCRLERDAGTLLLRAEGFLLGVSPQNRSLIERRGAKEVVVGVRPEHVMVREGDPVVGESPLMLASIAVIEPLGNQTQLGLSVGKLTLTAVVPADRRFRPRQSVQLFVDPARVLLFDAGQGGAAIC